jgi:hypothetical protein
VRIAVAALLLAWLGCASAQTRPGAGPDSLPPGWSIDGASGDLVHAGSGLRFAAQREGCARVDPHAFDASGENVSIGYNCADAPIWLTAYVYPASFGGAPSPPEHFRMVVTDALVAHPGAQVDRAQETTLPLGARRVRGFHALLHWTQDEREIDSLLVLIPDGSRFVKVRTSTARHDLGDARIERAWQLTLAVLRGAVPGP